MTYSEIVSTELIFIFNQLPYSYFSKIPAELIHSLNKSFSFDVYNKMDPDIPFFKQDLSSDTKMLIQDIAEKYFI